MMTKNLLFPFIVTILFITSCNSKNIEKQNIFNYAIDSSFIVNINFKHLEENKSISNFKISEKGDEIFSFMKPKMKFWTYAKNDFNEDIKLQILLTTEPKDMALDGSLNLAFLGSFNSKNKLVDLLRIGKRAIFSDTDELETCMIKENLIQKNIRSYELSDSGYMKVEKVEKYQILKNGKFKKL